MPFFVAVHHEAWPGRVDQLVTALRNDFAASSSAQPGRKFARLFRHLDDPTRFLAMEEWQSQDEFDRHQRSPAYAEAVTACGPSPRPQPLARLQHYRHMPHAPSALACTTLETPPERAAAVESFICNDERRDALVAAGLVLRAVYRVIASPGRLLVLHGWQSLDHLNGYFRSTEQNTTDELVARGASVERFAGQITAEFSWLDS